MPEIAATEPELCECCDAPAAKWDEKGIPLCDECYEYLLIETNRIRHPEGGD
jgi:hypothetical protein